ncbi:MAG: heavy metal translocating P-type ATPase [Lachnospiraceae bacterium]|nr:heavy metal translocating P-type ATPase [Lachnospiraceae bacterium]
MDARILSDTKGRIRVRLSCLHMSFRDCDVAEYYFSKLPGIKKVEAIDNTHDLIIRYTCPREEVINAIASYQGADNELLSKAPEDPGRAVNREYQEKLAVMVTMKAVRMLLYPANMRAIRAVRNMIQMIIRAVKTFRSGKLKVEVLDAISISVSVLRGDFRTAANVSFLLKLGDLIEEWTRKKSVNDLAKSMSLNIDRVWMVTGDTETEVPITDIQKDDVIVIRRGSVIPLDGMVIRGEASVNQASMTGEAVPVRKSPGAVVYAGTVLEEGECYVRVENPQGSGRYDKIIKMIEESQKMQSTTESRAMAMADKLVPYSLAGTLLTFILTRNAQKAVSVLMVDFSCALKLSMPVSVLSAMRECGDESIVVKGGKYLEAVEEADTIVFDKTGTLTYAKPEVAKVIAFDGEEENEVLRVAACLEEHFPHSMANAVVFEAVRRGIVHEEMHSEVEYVVAHGIASAINGKRALIGSAHFIFQDEDCVIPEGEQEKFDSISGSFSQLYLAVDGRLKGVICIADPLREEVPETLSKLREMGLKNLVMMTGDSEKTAAMIAKEAGVDSYRSEVLPADKAEFIRREREKGHKVIMVGDGINDSPALSEADAGIAISDGAAIARQTADITVRADSLKELITLRKVSMALRKRVDGNYRFVLGFNGTLLLLGILGFIAPGTSAMLHNSSTIGLLLYSMTDMTDH